MLRRAALQAIRVGDRVFEFTAHEESNCDLVRVPKDLSAAALATDIGPITQRLYVKVRIKAMPLHRFEPGGHLLYSQRVERLGTVLSDPGRCFLCIRLYPEAHMMHEHRFSAAPSS